MVSEKVKLSAYCLDCFKRIMRLSYAHGLELLLTQYISPETICQIVRNMRGKKAEPAKGDTRVSYFYQGIKQDFILGEGAIIKHRPYIEESSCLSLGVQLLSEYERYLVNVVKASDRILSEMKKFKLLHKLERQRKPNCYWNENMGRGTVFLKELFYSDLHPNYDIKLKFLFHVRNLAVHHRGIIGNRFHELSTNASINIEGDVTVGARIKWNLSLCMQTQELIFSLLLAVDPYVVSRLGLSTSEVEPFWSVV